ncbi:MAG: DNA repair protein RadA [Oscillospiraceae bacterium]|nr:DNA repair protein RadA [Oscillospiraceae bacterium]
MKNNILENIESQRLSSIDIKQEKRIDTGFKELNCVLGGGVVSGSVTLLGGSPGVGKSTLLLQVCQYISNSKSIFYFSGEESEKQIKLRANRLGVSNENIFIISENDIENIAQIIQASKPGLVIIDSIQTMRDPEISSSAGSVTQVRESTNLLMNLAKSLNIAIIIVGHINKDGGIAGPKVLEHIVDTVLYFESEKYSSYKILRTTKNRFGPTNEIGIFEMQNKGLVEVASPSMALIQDGSEDKSENMSGTAITCITEGSRPIFIEVQALVAKSDFAVPRRVSTGFDYNRTCFILAVLEKKCGYFFNKLDVYVNIIGGVRLNSPGADLAVATAIVSSVKDKIIDPNTVILGEIGLTGEIRAAPNFVEQIIECEKLGFKKCVVPKASLKILDKLNFNLNNLNLIIKPVRYIWEYLK